MLYDIFRSKKLDVRLVGNIGNPLLQEKKNKKEYYLYSGGIIYQIVYNKYFKSDYAAI